MKLLKLKYMWAAMGVATTQAPAQPVVVDINLNVRHEVGGISTFDRSKFITIHSNHTDGDWGDRYGANFTDDLLADFVLGNDVYFGRDTGYITGQLKSNIDEDPDKPGWARVSGGNYSMATEGLQARQSYDAKTSIHSYEDRLDGYIIGAQFRPFWPEGDANCGRTGYKWAISTTDTPEEPFGSATGNYMGNFLNHYYGSDTQVGLPLPKWVEVVNEPDWPLFEWSGDDAYGTSSPAELWTFHNSVADQIHSLNSNVMVGGYCPAFPDLERDDFEEWKDEWAPFIDTCGTNMDFYTIHFYDIDQSTKSIIRRGSFTEAVFDMIEQYTQLQVGKQLPFVVSEFAGKDNVLSKQGWSALHDWKRIKSMSGYLMSFMDRPNLIGKAMPFIMVKCEWGRNDTTGIPYSARLMRQADEIYNPTNTTGEWVYTEHVKFYQLWSDVSGTRVDTISSDPDIQIDAYVDGTNAYVILNNMDTEAQTIDLNLFEDQNNAIQTVREKNMYWDGSSVALDDTTHAGAITQVQLGSEGTAVLEYSFASPVSLDKRSEEVKYYATTYFQPIAAGQTNIFHINDVTKGTYGEAVLRLSTGRDTTLSKQPAVLFNGTPLEVPTDFLGHEGDDRDIFFGTLDIPVPYELLQASNTVAVTYTETGGSISSVTLRAFEFSSDIRHPIDGIPIDFHQIVGSEIILGCTNGPADQLFSLLSKTNLLDLNWTVSLTDQPIDTTGFGSITNPAVYPAEFFKLVKSEPAAVIEFTTPDYSDGALNGQQNWNAQTGWAVEDSSGSGSAQTTENTNAAVLDEPIRLSVGHSYSLCINLQFTGFYSTPINYVYTFLGGVKTDNSAVSVSTGGSAADANIQLYGSTDQYRLLNNYTPLTGASSISGALNDGDLLQFDYQLTLAANAESTTCSVRLQNLTDGTDTGTGTITGVDTSIYSALTGNGAYGFFQSIAPGANESGLTGTRINSVTTDVTP